MYPDAPKMSGPQRPPTPYEEAALEWTTARERRDAATANLNAAKEEAQAAEERERKAWEMLLREAGRDVPATTGYAAKTSR